MSKFLDDFPNEDELKKIIMHTSEIVWKHELTDIKIEKWLSNFSGEVFDTKEERIIALWLLNNFVYYNEEEVRHLCTILFKEFIHKNLELEERTADNLNYAIRKIVKRSCFLPVGKPSESSGFILYFFRQVNDLHMSNFLLPPNLDKSEILNLVFVDDVTLTPGIDGQAHTFIKKFDNKGKRKLLLTLVATDDAIESFKKIGIDVISPIILDNRNKCFNSDSYIFHSLTNYTDKFKTFAEHYGIKAKSKIPLGYENGQFAFGFFYNTPDNTLPIFWGEENNWYPIVKRYDKNYFRREIDYDDRFV